MNVNLLVPPFGWQLAEGLPETVIEVKRKATIILRQAPDDDHYMKWIPTDLYHFAF